jgi:hypothetical protein
MLVAVVLAAVALAVIRASIRQCRENQGGSYQSADLIKYIVNLWVHTTTDGIFWVQFRIYAIRHQAILTFPGWLVINRAKTGIKVLNPKGVRAAVVNSRLPALPKQLNERVAYQLGQNKCRDVEF